MIVVIDASGSIKWFFPESEQEQDTDQAIQLLRQVQSGRRITLVQPAQPK
jgi:hypothetical protein